MDNEKPRITPIWHQPKIKKHKLLMCFYLGISGWRCFIRYEFWLLVGYRCNAIILFYWKKKKNKNDRL